MSKNKLLYVHAEDGFERAEHRTEVARGLGFTVMTILNNEDFSPVRETKILNLVDDESFAGVWLDFDYKNLSPTITKLTLAAGKAEKPLLGQLPPLDDDVIKQRLIVHIGLPVHEGVTQ